jgi:hypothetical protein
VEELEKNFFSLEEAKLREIAEDTLDLDKAFD